jgi:hypothetical protein
MKNNKHHPIRIVPKYNRKIIETEARTTSITPGLTLNQIDQLLPHWSNLLSAVQVHTTTHCRFNREQLDPTPP